MLVSSDENGAQSRVPGEATRFFDDIGCLAADPQSRAANVARYVRAGDRWAAADSAWFAMSTTARTPMDYGIVAFERADEAQAADRDGQARRWPAIVTYMEAR
jgi:hypothetical protein